MNRLKRIWCSWFGHRYESEVGKNITYICTRCTDILTDIDEDTTSIKQKSWCPFCGSYCGEHEPAAFKGQVHCPGCHRDLFT